MREMGEERKDVKIQMDGIERSELKPAFAGSIGERLDDSMVGIGIPIENHDGDTHVLRLLRNERAQLLPPCHVWLGFHLPRGRGNNGLSRIIINELRSPA
jgi:hypothetical protein